MTRQAGITALPARWAQRDDFVVLDASFGQGDRFLGTWATWLNDPQRCRRLVYIALGTASDLSSPLPDATTSPGLAQRLATQWPTLTRGLHTLSFDEGPASGMTLLLGVGDADELVPQLIAWVDALDLRGLPAQPASPNGDHGWLSRLARLAAPGCVAMARADDAALLGGLAQSGFKAAQPDIVNGDAHFTTQTFSPRHTPPPLAGGLWPSSAKADDASRHALVIGAGLAGCAAARGLARQGWRITVVDALPQAAQAASGNPGGLFHSIVHGEDGIHARAHRAAALRTAAVVLPRLSQHEFAGQCQGLLRLDAQTTALDAEALMQRLDLPPDHVQWLDQAQAAIASGLPVPCGGWLFHQGGWLDPSAYARALLNEAQACAEVALLAGRQVQRLQRVEDGESALSLWQALDAEGQLIAQAPVAILASAVDTASLIATLPEATELPLSSLRGQLSSLPLTKDITAPRLPVAGAGYVLPAHQGRLLFGATSQAGDADASLRKEDHWLNVEQAAQLGCLAQPPDAKLLAGITGRVGWRATTPDRLPYIGPLPLANPPGRAPGQKPARTDQPRFVPRLRDEHGGVYVIAGLGSRGITWAALAGELLASWVTGSPSPIEGPLRDALDPARIVTRARAREMSG